LNYKHHVCKAPTFLTCQSIVVSYEVRVTELSSTYFYV